MGTEIKCGADGLFAVCFRNFKAYDENKILEIFGRYGHVVSVRFTGKDITGMVFVRYKEYNAAKNCLEDLHRRHELNVKVALSKPPFLDGPKLQSGRYVQVFVKVICITCLHENAYYYVRFEVMAITMKSASLPALQRSVDKCHQATWLYVPEDRTLHITTLKLTTFPLLHLVSV
jgi:hypothetical protein